MLSALVKPDRSWVGLPGVVLIRFGSVFHCSPCPSCSEEAFTERERLTLDGVRQPACGKKSTRDTSNTAFSGPPDAPGKTPGGGPGPIELDWPQLGVSPWPEYCQGRRDWIGCFPDLSR